MEPARSRSAPALPSACGLRKHGMERGRLAPEPGAPRAPAAPGRSAQAAAAEVGRSRSGLCPPHAYNLRDYSVKRGRLAADRGAAAAKIVLAPSHADLLGGNGRWRQRRAQEQWVLDQAEEERRRREREALEGERRRRGEEREAARQRQQQEDAQRLRALEEERRGQRLAAEEREAREREERRRKAEQEHSDWLARQPKPCGDCLGSGRCTHCGGRGFFFALFLAPSVGSDAAVDFGRAPQGCPECGGCAQNVLARLVQGSGRCHGCDGVGTVTPKEVQVPQSPKGRPALHRGMSNARRLSGGCTAFAQSHSLLGDVSSPTARLRPPAEPSAS